MRLDLLLLVGLVSVGCSSPALRLTANRSPQGYVRDRLGGSPGDDPATLQFRPGVCDGEDLRPDYAKLDESALVRFLERQHIDVRIERPRADLTYLNMGSVGTEQPVRLRVAILGGPDEAGQELHRAVLEHGTGSWGVHRSNLAVLGPVGSISDDVTFAAMTKLACWGVFTIAGRDDTFVVPGAYTEL